MEPDHDRQKTENAVRARFHLNFPGSGDSAFSLDVDTVIPGSGVTAIFGQSGSGKTTFLRCIAGLDRTDHGYLTVNGEVWQNARKFLPTHKRPLGYVFQESSLFPHLSAKGNLDYAVRRARPAVTGDLYRQAIEVMGIEPFLHRFPDQLSGGERQRVAIARALLIQPRLLLMDEPLASLDTARKQEILPYLERLRSTFEIPVLYVSHSMDEVAHLADHAIVLHQGRIVAQGNLTEVFSRLELSSQFGEEAGVILDGRITERDTRWHLAYVEFSGGGLWVRDGGDEVGQQVRIRVLARDISIALTSHTDSSILNRVSVEIIQIENTPDEAMAMVRLRAGDDYLVGRVTGKSVHDLKLENGKQVLAQIKSVAIIR